MAILDKSRVVAAKIETVFNQAETLTDVDALQIQDSTKVDASMDTVERSIIQDSLLKTAPIPVRENTTGSLNVELMPSGTADDLLGDVLWEAALGVKSPAGTGTGCFIGYSDAGVTASDMITLAGASDTGTGTAYLLGGTTDPTKSLTIKEFVGATTSVETTGNVVSSVSINLPTADVASVSFSVEGCGFTTNNADTKLTPPTITTIPYLGKSAKFVFDGTSVSATDVSININNSVYNEEGITSDGYTSKQITAKDISGSFTLLFDNYDLLTKLQNNTDGSLYVELTQGVSKFAIYIPSLKLTSFGKSTNNGVITQSVDFNVVVNASGTEPIIIANQTA